MKYFENLRENADPKDFCSGIQNSMKLKNPCKKPKTFWKNWEKASEIVVSLRLILEGMIVLHTEKGNEKIKMVVHY